MLDSSLKKKFYSNKDLELIETQIKESNDNMINDKESMRSKNTSLNFSDVSPSFKKDSFAKLDQARNMLSEIFGDQINIPA